MRYAVKHIHFVGIGGAGMSGIAEVLLKEGYQVSGSDAVETPVTRRLAAAGARVHVGHDPKHVRGANVVVISTAIKHDNPEIAAARKEHIPVIPRALMLAELMRLKRIGIAVAGTHGKTTTTSLIASVLAEAGEDPTFVIGGRLTSAGSHARLGVSDFLVVEADESDASFLHLQPAIAVVTNIDLDHMETYGHSLSRLKGTFIDFLERLPFYGAAVVCGDDHGVRDIIPLLSKRVVTYGTGPEFDIRATAAEHHGGQMRFTAVRSKKMLRRKQKAELEVTLNLPGLHNVLNACAAIGVALEIGLDDDAVSRALENFQGVGRRLQRFGEIALRKGCTVSLVDDYGHHPAEMRVTLDALRGAFPHRRLLLAFQPHRYTRTRDLFDSFIEVLSSVDELILTEVYAAGETPIAGADGSTLYRAIRRGGGARATFVAGVSDLGDAVRRKARDGDVVVTMGAGSIGGVAPALARLKDEG